jgi:thiosulfate/3-mercaptopyruvate sulfurtransferase
MRTPLIDVAELRTLLPNVTLLDVRWVLGRTDGHEVYRAGHIPGGVFVDLNTALADPAGAGGRHPLPDPDRFVALMRAFGVSNDCPVVVYDDVAGTSAARAWWLLKYFGHSDVRLLDGGWSAWVTSDGPVETGDATVGGGDFSGRPGSMPVLEVDYILAFATSGTLIDARAAERFRGETEPVDPVAGHIPGAINVPTAANLDGGRFKSVEELREVYAAALEGPVACYCGSGVTAAHDVLALSLLGVDAALYPGSWSHWVTDRSRPVATG